MYSSPKYEMPCKKKDVLKHRKKTPMFSEQAANSTAGSPESHALRFMLLSTG